MIQTSEIITLVLGIGAMSFIHINLNRLKKTRHIRVLIHGFYFLLLGWIITILEGFFLNSLLNIIEHLCYSVGAFFIMLWVFVSFRKKKDY